jgi:hypothetical protein
MSVTVTDYTPRVKETLQQKASIFLRMMSEEILAISTPKTPRDTGQLRGQVSRQVLGLTGKMTWERPYAMVQEATQFKHYTTSGTGPHYAENAVKEGISRTGDVARKVGLI